MTFSAESAQVFKMTKTTENLSSYEFPNLEYSVNYGPWYDVAADSEVLFGENNGSLRLRGKNNLNGTATDINNFSTISFREATVPVKCTGDIRTLLDYTNFQYVDTQNAKFCLLFNGCTQLTSAPELPAMELGVLCYLRMFSGCSSLTQAPALPATTLSNSCYYGMFWQCTSLTQAPELKAETLVNNCYCGIFYGCTNLSSVTMLATDGFDADNCLNDWLKYAGTSASSRTLKVNSQTEYNKIKSLNSQSSSVLSVKWQAGASNTTILDKDDHDITSTISSTNP